MSQNAKRAILMTLRGVALLVLLGGVFFTWYPFPLGLLIAIGIWVLSPALSLAMGLEPEVAQNAAPGTTQRPKSTGKFLSFILGAIAMAAILILLSGTNALGSWGEGWMQSWISSGDERTETRVVSDFDQVSFSGLGTLVITQGDQESLMITGSSNYIDSIKTDVTNGRLTIKPRAAFWLPWMIDHDTIFTLTVKNLSAISINGSGKIRSDALTSKDLSIRIAGSGDIRMDVSAQMADIQISGSGNVILTGSIEEQRLEINGSGSIDTRGVTSKKASIDISGSGDTIVAATDALLIKISGSGNVSYLGSPALTQTISGSGKIKKIEE